MSQSDTPTARTDSNAAEDRLESAAGPLFVLGISSMMAALLFLVWWTRSVFFLLFAGIVFGVFLQGLSEAVSDFTKLSYFWSLGLVVVLLLTAAILTGWFLGERISHQFAQLAQTLPDAVQKLQVEITTSELGMWFIEQTPSDKRLPIRLKVISQLTGFLGQVLNGVMSSGVIVFVGFYGASEPGLYRAGVLHLVPKSGRTRAEEVLDALKDSLRRWLAARLISMLIVGVLTSLGLWLLTVPMPLALGLLAFCLVAIPNLGPLLASVPALLVAWTHGGLHLVVQTIVLYAGIETVESYLLLPLLQEKTVYLPPVLSVIVVVFFGTIGGIIGAFIAAPLLVVLMVLVEMLYVENVLGDHSQKGLTKLIDERRTNRDR